MGFGSGARIMQAIINGIEKTKTKNKKEIYKIIISALEDADWDTQSDCRGSKDYEDALKELHPDWYEDEK